jgi:hypothetical protein
MDATAHLKIFLKNYFSYYFIIPLFIPVDTHDDVAVTEQK